MITPQYLAGLIDGEGYIALLPSKAKGLKNLSFEPVVKIGMTDDAFVLLETIRAQYGGTMELRSKKTKGNRNAYTWTLKGRVRVSSFLERILPFLLVKRNQAELLLEFCHLPMTHSRHKAFDQEALHRKITLYNLLKQLKQPLATTE